MCVLELHPSAETVEENKSQVSRRAAFYSDATLPKKKCDSSGLPTDKIEKLHLKHKSSKKFEQFLQKSGVSIFIVLIDLKTTLHLCYSN